MSAPVPALDRRAPRRDIRALADLVRRNRFIPRPPPEQSFVGDGDFAAIGAEFLRHFVEIGGLEPHDRVLEIGSGIGRMALPLTQYLDPVTGSYDGVDPVKAGIDWSSRTVTPVYPRFRFRHLDIRHPIYNPGGSLDGAAASLPYDSEAFDFAALVSVVTHLPGAEVARYAAECARVLAADGRVFVTAFILDAGRARRAGEEAAPGPSFRRAGEGPEWHADPDHPLGAVAYDDGWLEDTFAAAGFGTVHRRLGWWRGRPAEHYQDILVFEKRERRA